MRAYRNIASIVKKLFMPMFVLRPWPNAKSLELAVERLVEYTEGGAFILDIDDSRFPVEPKSDAEASFAALFDASDGYEKYFAFIEGMDTAIPVLQGGGADKANMSHQITRAAKLQRGLVVRIEWGREDLTHILSEASDKICDLVVVVDAGWSREVLQRLSWADSILKSAFEKAPGAEFVVCGSSFPGSFSDISSPHSFQMFERDFYDELVRRNNAISIKYGDWGSTRADKKGGAKGPNRIDLALPRQWVSYRDNDDEFSYSNLCSQAIESREWNLVPECWGRHALELCSLGPVGVISNQEIAASIRINMHLTIQASYDLGPIKLPDEPFED